MNERRPGDWTCHQHGVVVPDRGGPVPSCPVCGAMAMLVRANPLGYLDLVQPQPACCAGPDRHPFGPDQVTLHFTGCLCPPVLRAGGKGHTSWLCRTCRDEQAWPPHEG